MSSCKTDQGMEFYGNYSNYFKKRNNSESRVSLLDREWVSNKTCLDIGCNIGFFPSRLTQSYKPILMVAIDRDFKLIDKALKNLEKETANSAASTLIPRSVSLKNDRFPKNIKFLCDDVFTHLVSLSGQQSYQFISCMSVIKWIHLEHGDEKLIEIFKLIYHSLHPGGIFALEYQPWKSYKNARRKSTILNESFKRIKFHPEDFEDILQSEIGFEIIARRGPSLSDAMGYNRPILICRKIMNIDKSSISKSKLISSIVSTHTEGIEQSTSTTRKVVDDTRIIVSTTSSVSTNISDVSTLETAKNTDTKLNEIDTIGIDVSPPLKPGKFKKRKRS